MLLPTSGDTHVPGFADPSLQSLPPSAQLCVPLLCVSLMRTLALDLGYTQIIQDDLKTLNLSTCAKTLFPIKSHSQVPRFDMDVFLLGVQGWRGHHSAHYRYVVNPFFSYVSFNFSFGN